jgi:hypothetical protein
MAKSLNPPFDRIISEEEIQSLRSLHRPAAVHPLVSVALHPGEMQSPGRRAFNTMRALRHALETHSEWVQALKSRLIDQSSWSEADGALGELRAIGALLEAGFKVVAGSKDRSGEHGGTQPEFVVEYEGQELIVEVWTRTGDQADPERIEQELKDSAQIRELSGGRKTTSSIAEMAPFGMPIAGKAGDSVLTNTISRLASVKKHEHQARSGKPFIVWIDLQSEAMMFDNSSHLSPLTTYNGELYSGGYWCAFYARKGDILFEGDRYRSVGSSEMLHDGRFYQTKKNGEPTKAAAFVLSSPESTAIFEHPNADHPIPGRFRRDLVGLPWFDLERSVINWKPGLVTSTVEAQRGWINAVASACRAYEG